MPFFESLMSPANRSGYSQVVSPGGNKIKTLILTHSQRWLESQVTQPGSCVRSCVATTKRGELTSSCQIDPCDYWEASELIETNDFIYSCKTDEEYVAKKMQQMLDGLVRKVATDATSQSASLLNGWASDVTPVTGNNLIVQTLKSVASGDINPKAFADIDFAMQQNNFCLPTTIFAGSTLYKYYQLMQAGCCSNQGLDLEKVLALYGKAVVYDMRVSAAAGGNDFAWALLPGALQVATYNENYSRIPEAAGITVGTNYQKGVVFDPQTGLPVDLTLSDNCGKLSIFMRANIKVCGLPEDLYAPGDRMEGVTGFAGIRVVNS